MSHATVSAVTPDRCRAAAFGALLGDVLGAAVEGESPESILKGYPNGLRCHVTATHMGVYHLPPRRGMYTDDTTAAAALLSSIVSQKCLCAPHAAYTHARAWYDGHSRPPLIGLPKSAEAVLFSVVEGKPARTTSTLSFPDGSFANGAAMKIYPVALAFHSASPEVLHEAVRAACCFTHVHPDAVESAFVLAFVIQQCLHLTEQQHLEGRLRDIIAKAKEHVGVRSETMCGLIDKALSFKPTNPSATHSDRVLELVQYMRNVLGKKAAGFQISGCSAVFCVIIVVLAWGADDERKPHTQKRDEIDAIALAIGLGGDTDTIATMVGAVVGALCPGTAQFGNDDDERRALTSELDPKCDPILDNALLVASLNLTSASDITESSPDSCFSSSRKTAADRAMELCNAFNASYYNNMMRETLDVAGFIGSLCDLNMTFEEVRSLVDAVVIKFSVEQQSSVTQNITRALQQTTVPFEKSATTLHFW
eukprot:PhM_4_TR15690/c2_g2_i2/m.54451/K11687/ADPRHL2; poly(ADP-ribose) glycohydrolase ARH3